MSFAKSGPSNTSPRLRECICTVSEGVHFDDEELLFFQYAFLHPAWRIKIASTPMRYRRLSEAVAILATTSGCAAPVVKPTEFFFFGCFGMFAATSS